jgi:hypothetical protein
VWLCCLQVLVDEATEDWSSLDVGDGRNGGLRGRGGWLLAEGLMRVTATASDDGTRGAVKTGYSTDSQGVYSDRSVFEFDISGVRGAAIRSAQFSLVQTWSWKACGGSAPPVRLFETPGIDGSTTWNTGWNASGSGWGAELGSNADVRRYNGTGNCASSRILFNVQGKIQSLANAGAGTVTLGLKGDGDLSADLTGHRRYDLATVYLSIDYNLPPDRPDGLLINGKPCTQGPGRSVVNRGVLTIRLSDRDSDNLSGLFVLQRLGGNDSWGGSSTVGTASVASGQTAQVTATGLSEGVYRWQAQATDPGGLVGPWSDWCEFAVDTTPPPAPGGITSTDFPPTGIGAGVGQVGTVTITSPGTGAADIAGYVWALTPYTTPPTDGGRTIAASRVDHTATVAVFPSVPRLNTLRVWSIDAAGNISDVNAPLEYQFRVGPGTRPIYSGIPGKCVDDANNAATNGNPVTLSDCTGGASQMWAAPGDGTLRINDRCLDVSFEGVTNGSKVALYDCIDGAVAQQWQRTSLGGLRNPHAGLCLDVPAEKATINGTQLQIWDCNGSPQQSFTFDHAVGTFRSGDCRQVPRRPVRRHHTR